MYANCLGCARAGNAQRNRTAESKYPLEFVCVGVIPKRCRGCRMYVNVRTSSTRNLVGYAWAIFRCGRWLLRVVHPMTVLVGCVLWAANAQREKHYCPRCAGFASAMGSCASRGVHQLSRSPQVSNTLMTYMADVIVDFGVGSEDAWAALRTFALRGV